MSHEISLLFLNFYARKDEKIDSSDPNARNWKSNVKDKGVYNPTPYQLYSMLYVVKCETCI